MHQTHPPARTTRRLRLTVVLSIGAVLIGLPRAATAEWEPYAKAKAAFQAVIEKEKRLTTEAKALIQAAKQAEQRIAPQALTEALRARATAERLGRIESDIMKTFRERSEISISPVALDTEAKLLRRSYDEMVSGKTQTSVGLRLTTMLFEALHKHGALEPQRTTFTKIQDVRNALVAVRAKLAAAKAREAAKAGPLDQKLARLDGEHTRLLGEALERAGQGRGVANAAIQAWLAALRKTAAKIQELDAVRRELLAAHWSGIHEARAMPPPHLQYARIHTGRTIIYEAEWIVSAEARGTASKNHAAVMANMQQVASAIARLRREWFALANARMPQVKRLHADARVLESIAQEYAGAVWDNALAAVIIDSSVAVASAMLTGGTATLVSQLPTLAEDASAKYAKRMAEGGTREVTEALYGRFTGAGRMATQKYVQRVRAAAVKKDALIKAYVAAAELAAKNQGKNASTVAQAAEREAAKLLKRLDFERPLAEQLKRVTDLDALAKVRWARLIDNVAASYSVLGRKWMMDQVTGSKPLEAASPWGAALTTGLGDILGVASDAGISSYRAQRQALEGMSRWKALLESGRLKNLKKALEGNALNIGVTAMGTITKAALAKSYQERINSSSASFWKLYGEMAVRYQLYRQTFTEDRKLYDALRAARKTLATLQASHATLMAPPTLTTHHKGRVANRDHHLELSIRFSTPLSRAPRVTLGGRTITMQPEGGPRPGLLRERTWQGRIRANQLAAGDAKLSVALAPRTEPHAQLDTDPTTPPALLSPTRDRWLRVQAGADEAHTVPVDFQVHDALVKLQGFQADLATEGSKAEVLYGSGSTKTDQGWSGMGNSVKAAHVRLGAKPQGDPHGHAWMRFNGLGLKAAGSGRYAPALQSFADHLFYRRRAMATITPKESAYLAHVERTMQKWRSNLPRYHETAKSWLETIARFTVINGLEEAEERKAQDDANRKELVRLESELRRVIPPTLAPFSKWHKKP